MTAALKIILAALVWFFWAAPAAASGLAEAERGIEFQRFTVREEPWSINVIRIDRSRTDLEFVTSLGGGSRMGLSPMTEQLRRLPREAGRPLAAINGDFYHTEGERSPGDARGLHISQGELISGPIARAAFWIDTNGAPRMGEVTPRFRVTWPHGDQISFSLNEERFREPVLYTSAGSFETRSHGGVEFILEKVDSRNWLPLKPGASFPARIREIRRGGQSRTSADTLVLSLPRLTGGAAKAVRGDIIGISTDTLPSLSGVKTAIGGGPELVRGGRAQPAQASKSRDRHPRSAVGWNRNHIFFVVVDGRQPRLSMGMTLPELAGFLVKLGCVEAMNLDGGGSAQIWLDGKIMNSPCFGHERNTANSLVLVAVPEGRP